MCPARSCLPSLNELVGISQARLDSSDPHLQPKALLQESEPAGAGVELHEGQFWGYVILRTVYTSESDNLFPVAVKRIRDAMVCYLMRAESNHGDHQYLYDEVIRRLDLPVIEDRDRLNDIAPKEVRPIFQEWVASHQPHEHLPLSPRYTTCLVLDETAVRDVAALPEDLSQTYGANNRRYYQSCVKVVELLFRDLEDDDEYWRHRQQNEGVMKCDVGHIFELWYLQQVVLFEFEHLKGEIGYEFGGDDIPLFYVTKQALARFDRR